jgi:hypothetical protein
MDAVGPAGAELLFHRPAGEVEPAALKYTQSVFVSEIQIITGAVSAIERKRVSLSLKALVALGPSSVGASRDNCGIDAASRKNWSDTQGSSTSAGTRFPQ